jgi:hypothetical protein
LSLQRTAEIHFFPFLVVHSNPECRASIQTLNMSSAPLSLLNPAEIHS